MTRTTIHELRRTRLANMNIDERHAFARVHDATESGAESVEIKFCWAFD